VYRGPKRLGDIKLPWELNKHQYLFTLGKACWLTADPSPALEIVRQIDHWIEDNPPLTGINWLSGLEAGTRAVSWILAYPFYAPYSDPPFRQRLANSLAQHLLFVEQHLSEGPFANTHLIGEAATLVAGGLFLDCRHSRRWIRRGLALLDEQIETQVTLDGVHAERSIAYHRFFLDHYYLVAALLAANQRTVAEPTLKRMEQMTGFLMSVLFPDGTPPAFGDGDDARGLWVHANCSSDYRGLLALAAVLFRRGDFKQAAGRPHEEVLWLLGTEGMASFDSLAPTEPVQTSAAFCDAGYYVMRGGWEMTDPVAVFDAGPLGYGPAAHGHADALSFQLFANGFPFFIDSGTFSYNLDYTWRDLFRRTSAHNTVTIDGQDQSVPGDRMSWKTFAKTRSRHWLTTPWFDIADAEHFGYERLPDPVIHRRVIVFLKPDTWIVLDNLRGRERHVLEFILHLRPDCAVDLLASGGARLRAASGTVLNATAWNCSTQCALPFGPLKPGWLSPSYGIRRRSTVLSVTHQFEGEVLMMTCLSTVESPQGLAEATADSIHFRRQSTEGLEHLYYRMRGTKHPELPGGVLYDGFAKDNAPVMYTRERRECSPANA
jgi:hypothetical protein